MNNVEIQDGVTLINSLICSGSVIKAGKSLKDARISYCEIVGDEEVQEKQMSRRPSLF
jgi:NDP-sugar pyrophosphorylase family protein